MRALVKPDARAALRIEARPDPVPAAHEVLVAIRAVGICGTDLHILDGSYAHAEPLIPGHEFAGEIVGTGAAVTDWQLGERVIGELHVGACLACEICRSGNPQICLSKRALGTWTDGAFAELMTLPAWLLHRTPPELSDAEATLIEPAACAWHGLHERSQLIPGDRVLVVGHGPIGLLSAQLAIAGGAGQAILVGRSRRGSARLDCARTLGCEVLDASREDVQARIGELTGGRGVDLAVETAGSEQSLSTCVEACRRGGRVVVLGVSGRATVPMPWDSALSADLTFSFSFSSRAASWQGAIAIAASGGLRTGALLTHTFELDEFAAGFEAVRSGEAVKVVLRP